MEVKEIKEVKDSEVWESRAWCEYIVPFFNLGWRPLDCGRVIRTPKLAGGGAGYSLFEEAFQLG